MAQKPYHFEAARTYMIYVYITIIGISNHIAAIVRDLEKRWRILNFSDLTISESGTGKH